MDDATYTAQRMMNRYLAALAMHRHARLNGNESACLEFRRQASEAWQAYLATQSATPTPAPSRTWYDDRERFGPTSDPDAPRYTFDVPSESAKEWRADRSDDTLATINGHAINRYDVVQVKRGDAFLDFATIKDTSDARYAGMMMNGTHPERAWVGLTFRVARHYSARLGGPNFIV